MLFVHIERVQGDYIEPEVIEADDGTCCLFRLHKDDISEDGVKILADLLTEQVQVWVPRPPGTRGPVIPVRWERIPGLPAPFAVGVEEGPDGMTYTVDASLISQRAADSLAQIYTQRLPNWQRVPQSHHAGGTGVGE